MEASIQHSPELNLSCPLGLDSGAFHWEHRQVGPGRQMNGTGARARVWCGPNPSKNEKQESGICPRPGALPVCFPEHVPLPLGMDVLDDSSHSFPRFLGGQREHHQFRGGLANARGKQTGLGVLAVQGIKGCKVPCMRKK